MTVGADFNKEEKLEARRDGAELVKNSGRGQRKGDARRGKLLIDYKFTDKDSFALNKAAFNKHDKDAYDEGLEPVIVVVFDRVNRRAIVDWSYLMLLQDELMEMHSYNTDLESEVAELSEYKYRYESVSK